MSEEDYKKTFSKKLRYYLQLNGKTQVNLVKDLKFNKSTVSTWVNGSKIPRMNKIDTLCEYFGINRSDLIEDKQPTYREDKKQSVVINVLGRVAAGIPINAITEIIDTEEITEKLAKTGEFFGLKVKGDSMIPEIYDGDTVIVRQQDDAENGETVIVTINGYEATCKRLRKYKDGIALISNNPSYAPIELTNQEITEKPVRIIGKVVELRRKF